MQKVRCHHSAACTVWGGPFWWSSRKFEKGRDLTADFLLEWVRIIVPHPVRESHLNGLTRQGGRRMIHDFQEVGGWGQEVL